MRRTTFKGNGTIIYEVVYAKGGVLTTILTTKKDGMIVEIKAKEGMLPKEVCAENIINIDSLSLYFSEIPEKSTMQVYLISQGDNVYPGNTEEVAILARSGQEALQIAVNEYSNFEKAYVEENLFIEEIHGVGIILSSERCQ